MCLPMLATALAPALAGGTLATVGTLATAGATIYQGAQDARAARQQARVLDARAAQEAQLTAVQDLRERRAFSSRIRLQAAEIVGRGASLASPTAVMLGDQAGRELSFGSQAIRSGGAATGAELRGQASLSRAQARQAMLTGTLSAAAGLLTRAPDVWPELLA